MSEVDLVVIGGGPAGLATAINARLEGLTVCLFERLTPPIDKACGEGLMPDGVECLSDLGIEAADLGRSFTGVTYHSHGVVAAGRFSGRGGVGIRRTVLHRALVERAQDLGVDLRFGCAVRGLEGTVVCTASDRVEANWIVGADGLRSRVRQWLGIPVRGRKPRFGIRRHFQIEPWSDSIEVWWGDGCEAYVTPVADDLVGIALLWSGKTQRFDSLLQRFPSVERRLAGAAVASKDRGSGPLWAIPLMVARGRVALVGDAAGYLDAIAGEGLSLSFYQAGAVVDAILGGDLGAYRSATRKLARWPGLMTRALLAVERRPWLRRRVVGSLAREPEVFSRLLTVHARQSRVRDLGLRTAGRFLHGLVLPSG